VTRINWDGVGKRFFEAGVDRGVLYVGDNPGVPWIGLTAVNLPRSGGEDKRRYLDGMVISNYTSPEKFEATINAITFPPEFEPCDGTASLGNGLKARHQRRLPFAMCYRTLVGDDQVGTDLAYKIHILYNLRAQPAERGYETLNDDNDPMEFSWEVTGRGDKVSGVIPTAHYEIDSRDTPAELLLQLENMLYGSDESAPTLPSAGELVFLFDSFQDLVYDAGGPLTPVFSTHDAGNIDTPVTTTIDSGEV
jgi:hypothetical protein